MKELKNLFEGINMEEVKEQLKNKNVVKINNFLFKEDEKNKNIIFIYQLHGDVETTFDFDHYNQITYILKSIYMENVQNENIFITAEKMKDLLNNYNIDFNNFIFDKYYNSEVYKKSLNNAINYWDDLDISRKALNNILKNNYCEEMTKIIFIKNNIIDLLYNYEDVKKEKINNYEKAIIYINSKNNYNYTYIKNYDELSNLLENKINSNRINTAIKKLLNNESVKKFLEAKKLLDALPEDVKNVTLIFKDGTSQKITKKFINLLYLEKENKFFCNICENINIIDKITLRNKIIYQF